MFENRNSRFDNEKKFAYFQNKKKKKNEEKYFPFGGITLIGKRANWFKGYTVPKSPKQNQIGLDPA